MRALTVLPSKLLQSCRYFVAGLILFSAPLGAPFVHAESANPDPWEGLNRTTYAVNDVADRYVLKPVAKGYDAVMPEGWKVSVRNVFNNLDEPRTAVNQLLQGKPGAALSDATRFVMNSTIGFAGLFDPASDVGLERHAEDFGQTLGRWGVGTGPYLVVPFRGPSTVRDAFGMAFDSALNPLVLVNDPPTRGGLIATSVISLRADLLSAEDLLSGDAYVFLREAYLQRRDFLVSDGEVEDDPFLDDFDDFE